MMAAYASVVSLMTLIDQIHHHPSPPIALNKEHVESLREDISILQEFLEVYPQPQDVIDEGLERRIAGAAYAVEDLIESYIADRIEPMVRHNAVTTARTFHRSRVSSIAASYEMLNTQKSAVPPPLAHKSVRHGGTPVITELLRQRNQNQLASSSTDSALGKAPQIEEEPISHRDGAFHLPQPLRRTMIEPDAIEQIGGTTSEGAMMDEQFHRRMQKVLLDMNFVKEEVTQIKEKFPVENYQLHEQLFPTSMSTSQSTGQKSSVVVIFDDALEEVMDKLTGHPSSLQIIPIHGMGGIGKTTLAKNAYENSTITCRFDIRSWVTISQEYNVRKILLQFHENKKELSEKSEVELGDKLHKTLFGRRYLFVMDDMWSIEAWNEVKHFFPDNNNGSRIMVTTRLSSVAFQLTDSYSFKMNFLDEDRSWNLLCKYVFGEEACPVDELKNVGRRIAKDCKGLPLSIAAIGGLLAKSQWTPDYWEHIAEHLKSFLYLQDEEYCFRILHTSYKSLPTHLKPCFLYLGVFPEDEEIISSELINMWVAEGFVKPISGKSLEEAAKEYLDDLINRNLIFHEHDQFRWEPRTYCHVHDLIRDLCLREAEKEKFLFNTILKHSPHVEQGFNPHRRIVVHQSTSECPPQVPSALQSTSLVRSLICNFKSDFSQMPLRLCRVFKSSNANYNVVCTLLNSRFLRCTLDEIQLPTWINLFWNIQTLVIGSSTFREIDIWKMYQLRHVEVRSISLVNPQLSEGDYGLVNLQTLSLIRNFTCGEEVVERIPNIKKLEIWMEEEEVVERIPNILDIWMEEESLWHDYHLENLGNLQNLEDLSCNIAGTRNGVSESIRFPYSLKTLYLQGVKLHWDDITARIGSLPLLQELRLHSCGVGPKWNSIEGKFTRLRSLTLWHCTSLREWRAESSHFPCLERLLLRELSLTEIPSSIGDIPTLQYIDVCDCNKSLHISAMKIEEEQVEFGNDGLEVVADYIDEVFISAISDDDLGFTYSVISEDDLGSSYTYSDE